MYVHSAPTTEHTSPTGSQDRVRTFHNIGRIMAIWIIIPFKFTSIISHPNGHGDHRSAPRMLALIYGARAPFSAIFRMAVGSGKPRTFAYQQGQLEILIKARHRFYRNNKQLHRLN